MWLVELHDVEAVNVLHSTRCVFVRSSSTRLVWCKLFIFVFDDLCRNVERYVAIYLDIPGIDGAIFFTGPFSFFYFVVRRVIPLELEFIPLRRRFYLPIYTDNPAIAAIEEEAIGYIVNLREIRNIALFSP